jgi:hypothetical protein
MKSQRISVSGRNLQFLQQLSQDMDENSLTEVLSYLLTDIRLLNYQIGNKPAPTPQPQQTSLGYSFDTSIFEPAFAPLQNNENAIDPTIQRLIDAGLEMDF